MAARTFSCSNCNEPISVHLPEDVTRADSSKCQDIDTNYHNLERTIQCQNCDHKNTIYDCTKLILYWLTIRLCLKMNKINILFIIVAIFAIVLFHYL